LVLARFPSYLFFTTTILVLLYWVLVCHKAVLKIWQKSLLIQLKICFVIANILIYVAFGGLVLSVLLTQESTQLVIEMSIDFEIALSVIAITGAIIYSTIIAYKIAKLNHAGTHPQAHAFKKN